jgi:hypothetical protein
MKLLSEIKKTKQHIRWGVYNAFPHLLGPVMQEAAFDRLHAYDEHLPWYAFQFTSPEGTEYERSRLPFF